jgi:hypothetical protein
MASRGDERQTAIGGHLMLHNWERPQWEFKPWPWPDGDPPFDIWSIIRDNPAVIELDPQHKVLVYQALVDASNALQTLRLETTRQSQEILFNAQKQIGSIMEKQVKTRKG